MTATAVIHAAGRAPALQRLADLVIALVDLLEAEGRVLRQQTARVAGAMVFIALAGLLALGGVGLCLWGLYGHLAAAAGPANAALLTGAAALLAAGAGLWIATRLSG